MNTKPDVVAAVFYDENKQTVTVEFSKFEDESSAMQACDFLINLLDLHKAEVPFDSTLH
tara:strand:- start:833 stop:1009 length:177 start_codon:yes stop_codon:yes gene_type:complete